MSELRVTTLKHESATVDNITLDANGNVGIRGSSTGRFGAGVSIKGASPEVHLKRDDGNGEGGILLDNASSTQRLYVGTYNANQETHIGTNGTQRIIVDSAGRVTMPYQPAFNAKRTGGDIATTAVALFNVVLTNIGNHYSVSTGRFTAPVTGTYAFSVFCMGITYSNDVPVAVYFRRNGIDTGAYPYTRSQGAQYHGVAGSLIITLSTGDFVDIVNGGSCAIYGVGTGHNGFSGYLIG